MFGFFIMFLCVHGLTADTRKIVNVTKDVGETGKFPCKATNPEDVVLLKWNRYDDGSDESKVLFAHNITHTIFQTGDERINVTRPGYELIIYNMKKSDSGQYQCTGREGRDKTWSLFEITYHVTVKEAEGVEIPIITVDVLKPPVNQSTETTSPVNQSTEAPENETTTQHVKQSSKAIEPVTLRPEQTTSRKFQMEEVSSRLYIGIAIVLLFINFIMLVLLVIDCCERRRREKRRKSKRNCEQKIFLSGTSNL